MNVLATGQRVAPALTRYGSTAVAFHWAVAALVVFLGTLGLLFDDIPKESRAFWINIHGCVGLVYFALVIARLGWRTSHKPPDLPPDIGEFDRRFSLAAHHLLYALMVLIPIFGFVAFVWHGRVFDYGLARLNFGVATNRWRLSSRGGDPSGAGLLPVWAGRPARRSRALPSLRPSRRRASADAPRRDGVAPLRLTRAAIARAGCRARTGPSRR